MQSDQLKKLTSSLVVYGDTPKYTAMAKTVGLPVAIAVELILEKRIKLKGVQIPTIEEIYIPILKKLENFGITFVWKNQFKLINSSGIITSIVYLYD